MKTIEIEIPDSWYNLYKAKAKMVFTGQEIIDMGNMGGVIDSFIEDAIRDNLLAWFPDAKELKP